MECFGGLEDGLTFGGIIVVVVIFVWGGGDVGLELEWWHCSSSDPSWHSFVPLHWLSLLTQAPYVHLKAYVAHLKWKNIYVNITNL